MFYVTCPSPTPSKTINPGLFCTTKIKKSELTWPVTKEKDQ